MRIPRTLAAATAGALALGAVVGGAAVAANSADSAPQARGFTAVTLTDAGAAVLGALNVTPVGAAYDPQGPAQVAFPIVGNGNKGLAHVGGLALSDDEGGSLVLTNYLVSGIPGDLSAKAVINNETTTKGVPLFTVSSTGELRLTAPAVNAVAAVFGLDEIGPLLPAGVDPTTIVIGTAAPNPR